MQELNLAYVKGLIKKRPSNAHKGDFGKVLVYAGSFGMSGAAVLCGKAALRGGAGLVRFLLPPMPKDILTAPSPTEGSLYSILQTSVPEATCIRCSESTDFSEYSAIAAGPGLGIRAESADILEKILKTYAGTLVLDADALNIISRSKKHGQLVKDCAADVILTPHIGEARRLLGAEDISIRTPKEREDAFKALSEKYNAVIVLKGEHSLAGDVREAFINTTGNPGMATGGSGDVLTGLIAAIAGQGYSASKSAAIGVFIHGLAGDLAAGDLGEISLISSDIISYIPSAFKKVYPE